MSRCPLFLQLMRQGFLGTSGHSREVAWASRATPRPGTTQGPGGLQGLTAEPTAVVPGLEAAGEASSAEGAPGPLLVGQDRRPRYLPVAPVATSSWRRLPHLAPAPCPAHTDKPRPLLGQGPAHTTSPIHFQRTASPTFHRPRLLLDAAPPTAPAPTHRQGKAPPPPPHHTSP